MPAVCVKEFAGLILGHFEQASLLDGLSIRQLEESVHIRFESKDRLCAIDVWDRGLIDCEKLDAATGQGEWTHHAVSSTAQAIEFAGAFILT